MKVNMKKRNTFFLLVDPCLFNAVRLIEVGSKHKVYTTKTSLIYPLNFQLASINDLPNVFFQACTLRGHSQRTYTPRRGEGAL